MKAAAKVVLRRRRPRRADAGPGGDPRRPAEVALELRPRAATPIERVRRRASPRTRHLPGQDHARRAAGHDDRPAPEPDPRPPRRAAGRRCPTDQYSAEQTSTRPRTSRSSLAPQTTPRWIAPHFVWAVQEELADEALRRGRRPATQLEPAACAITTTLDSKLQKIAEKWVQAAAVVPNAKDPRPLPRRRLGLPAATQPWMKNLRGQGHPQRRARRARLPDRRARRLRRQRRLLRGQEHASSSSRSSTSSAAASASRARRSSRSTT